MRWGKALMLSQQWALQQSASGFYGDLGRTEQIFGDPALPVFAPPARKNGSGTPAVSTGASSSIVAANDWATTSPFPSVMVRVKLTEISSSVFASL